MLTLSRYDKSFMFTKDEEFVLEYVFIKNRISIAYLKSSIVEKRKVKRLNRFKLSFPLIIKLLFKVRRIIIQLHYICITTDRTNLVKQLKNSSSCFSKNNQRSRGAVRHFGARGKKCRGPFFPFLTCYAPHSRGSTRDPGQIAPPPPPPPPPPPTAPLQKSFLSSLLYFTFIQNT